ncbi:MAG: sugar ABC transporter substrate-binding protein [Treponema sp.]|jgi:ribose transport system substrate-binding protein|nr:sugar ABC transporter substrate-binding protein [Treponema sp.]
MRPCGSLTTEGLRVIINAMKMRWWFIIFLSLLFSTACQKVKIGFSVNDDDNPFWQPLYKGMREKAQELGVEVVIRDTKLDVGIQISDIEDFLDAGCKVVVIHPHDRDAVIPYVEKAHAKGVKIFAYDTELPDADVYCGFDNEAGGKAIGAMAGAWINERLDGKGVAAILSYPPIPALDERGKGIMEGILAVAPETKIVGFFTAGLISQGLEEGKRLMGDIPDVNVVAGINDAGVLGVYRVMVDAGWGNRNIGLFGCDALAEALEAIGGNTLYRGTIYLDTEKMGRAIIETAVAMLKGKQYNRLIRYELTRVTGENYGQYLE